MLIKCQFLLHPIVPENSSEVLNQKPFWQSQIAHPHTGPVSNISSSLRRRTCALAKCFSYCSGPDEVRYFEFLEKKGPEFLLEAMQEKETNSQHRKHSQSCVLEIIQAGKRWTIGGGSLEGENHGFIYIPIQDRWQLWWGLGARGSSCLCKLEEVTSLLWARALGHSRKTFPMETTMVCILQNHQETKLTLQSHNFHLHYCNLGWCPILL